MIRRSLLLRGVRSTRNPHVLPALSVDRTRLCSDQDSSRYGDLKLRGGIRLQRLSPGGRAYFHYQRRHNARCFCAQSRFESFTIRNLDQTLLDALKLKTYSDEEIGAAFDKADVHKRGFLGPEDVPRLLGNIEIKDVCEVLGIKQEAHGISRDSFVQGVGNLIDRLDPRIYAIGLSLMFTGFSIGIFGPALPLLIKDLGLTTTQIGFMTTGFGMTKLLGNIPCGVACDKYGRHPVIVFGCVAVALGTFVVGLGPILASWEPLLVGRCVNGVGVAALITGAFVAAADVSTPRNRVRTMAPINASFSFGNSFGPLMGGVSIGAIGLAPALLSCSGLLGANALASFWLIKETRPPLAATSLGFCEAYKASVASWTPFLKCPQLRQVTMYQAIFWGAFGAGFMTCVPIVLGSAKLGLSATSFGLVYGGIAATNVVAAQPLALMTDRIGKVPAMIGGTMLMGISLGALPHCADTYSLAMCLGGWALSSTLLFNLPQAIAADLTTEQERSNALAMVRTLGDTGLVLGGAGASLLGTTFSTDVVLSAVSGACIIASVSTLSRMWHRMLNGSI